ADELMKTMSASPGSTAAYWSHELYRGPRGEKISVYYGRSLKTSENVAQFFLGKPLLGFDMEWRPNATKSSGTKANVSLIQLACEDRIGLFHLALHRGDSVEDIMPPTLRKILESQDVAKVGVAILADYTRLQKHLGIQPSGLIELSHLHNLVMYSGSRPEMVTRKMVSLANQVQSHLQLPLYKGTVRTSDWGKELNHQQVVYAANDVYAGFRLYHVLESKRLAMNPVPPQPDFAERG
ncbi:ribonuclease H-like protein, partial [Trichodelitschia bisporula]